MDADFPRLRNKYETFHTDDITNVQFLKHAVIHGFIFTRTNFVTFGIYLDFAHGILKHIKRNGAHDALTHDTSGNAHFLEFGIVFREFLKNFCGGGIHLVFGCRIGINAEVQ